MVLTNRFADLREQYAAKGDWSRPQAGKVAFINVIISCADHRLGRSANARNVAHLGNGIVPGRPSLKIYRKADPGLQGCNLAELSSGASAHFNIPSSSVIPRWIVASSFPNRFRITFGASYSTASYSISL